MRASSEDGHDHPPRDVPPDARAAVDTRCASVGDATSRAARLIPRRLDFLVTERPLMWPESAAEYDALREEIFAELVPEGAIEAILVKNLVDALWEMRRFRRLKAHALNMVLPKIAGQMIEPGHRFPEQKRRDRLTILARNAVTGSASETVEGEESFEEAVQKSAVTPEMIQYAALRQQDEALERLDRKVEFLERRFHQLLKQFEARRERMAAMARSLMDRERSRVVDAVAVVED